MFFSDTDKAIIKDYHEREYAAYKLWKGNPEKQNSGEATYIEIEAFGTMERQNVLADREEQQLLKTKKS